MSTLWDIVTGYRSFGLIAFIVAVFATPIAARLARRLDVMDVPDRILKPHATPTPYLGGMAICLGWTVALLAAMVNGRVDWHLLLPIMLGGIAISIIGVIDDARDIAPKARLLLSTLVVAIVLLSTGTGFRLINSLVALVGIALPYEIPVSPFVGVPLSLVLSVFIVLGACNSSNLIDGLDGLCTGVVGFISFGFFLLAAHLASRGHSPVGDPVRLVLAMAMFGAAMGFLPLNFNPAKIFMGDAGSMLLGYNCGIMILLFAERGIFRWVVGALMIFALPVFDTALAMVRRCRAGRSIFAGDRSHFYDQLVQRGLTVRQSVLVSYLLTVVFGAIGLLVIWVRTRYAITIYLGVVAIVAVLAWATGLTTPEGAPRNRRSPGG